MARALRAELDKNAYPFSDSGRGEADPTVPNTSEKNRKLNRRVELTYRPTGQPSPNVVPAAMLL